MPDRRQQQADLRQRCEAKYRLGIYSPAELAAEFGVADTTVRTWARRYGWKQEPPAASTPSPNSGSSQTLNLADSDQPDDPDSEASELLKRHRSIGGRFERVIEHLVARLEEQVANQKMLVAVKDDVVEVDVPLEYIGKVLNAATQTFERVMKVQRQSYGLNDKMEDNRRPSEGLTDSQLEQKIRRLTQAAQTAQEPKPLATTAATTNKESNESVRPVP